MSHQHLKIYKTVPYNNGGDKYKDLFPYEPHWDFATSLSMSFDPAKRRNDLLGPNTAQRFYIQEGFISDKYDDEPYIVPFTAKGSKKAVLIVPGGAYQDVSLDQEGYPTAEYLQNKGITAFVLKYRVYPYKYPCAMLDCRRAINYIKYHAKEFDIDPNQLSIIGYSAGGNLVASTVYLFNQLPQIPYYKVDEIDKLDTKVNSLALVYPEIKGEKFLLSLQFGERILSDEAYYQQIKEEQNVIKHIKDNKIPLFACCAIDDGVVDPDNVISLAKACHDYNVKYEIHMFSNGGHGFGVRQEDFPPMFGIPARKMQGTKVWIDLYINWLSLLNE